MYVHETKNIIRSIARQHSEDSECVVFGKVTTKFTIRFTVYARSTGITSTVVPVRKYMWCAGHDILYSIRPTASSSCDRDMPYEETK